MSEQPHISVDFNSDSKSSHVISGSDLLNNNNNNHNHNNNNNTKLGSILNALAEKGSGRATRTRTTSFGSFGGGSSSSSSSSKSGWKMILRRFSGLKRLRTVGAFLLIFIAFLIVYQGVVLFAADRIHPIEQLAEARRVLFGVPMPNRATCPDSGPFKHQLTLFAIFKDAEIYLKEWVEFHRIVGFDHFLMYNNNSTDQFRKVLQPYVDMGIMTLIDYGTVYARDMLGNKIINTQKEGLIDGVMRFRCETKYMGVFDIDEFFFATDPAITNLQELLPQYLDTNDCGGVGAWRLNFGSNGHKERPKGLVLENYTHRHPVTWTGKKILFNPRKMAGLYNTHNFYFYDNLPLCDEAKRPQTFSSFSDAEESAIREVNILRINHYFTKSFQDWAERLKRGTISGNNAEFGWDLFVAGDNNDLLDESIARFLPELKKRVEDKLV